MPSPAFKLYQIPATSGPVATKIFTDFNRTVVAEIADPSGITAVEWSIFGASRGDKLLPTLTPRDGGLSVEVETPNDVDYWGRGWGLKCTINGGKNSLGRNEPSYTTTAGIWIANGDGFYPCFFGETFEFDPVVGWARLQPYLSGIEIAGDAYGPAGATQVQGIQGALFEDGTTLANGRSFFRYNGTLYQVGNVDFGAGEDGDLVVGAANVTLSRDMNYRTVTFLPGHTGKIETNGYALRIVTLNMANAKANAICVRASGLDAAGATPGTNGATGWLPRGQSGPAPNNSVGSVTSRQGGAGGSAGNATTNTANTRAPASAGENLKAPQPVISSGLNSWVGFAGASSTAEGAGAAGGGWMQLYVGILLNNGTCESGAISARGGQGGAATTSAGGGGGGGGGGVIDFRCALSLGDVTTDLLNADGGNGGGVTTLGKPTGAGGDGGRIHYSVTNSRTTSGIAGLRGRVDGTAGTVGTTSFTAGQPGGTCRVSL